VNAKLYHALVKWAAIERQLGSEAKAAIYAAKAEKLKAASISLSAKAGSGMRTITVTCTGSTGTRLCMAVIWSLREFHGHRLWICDDDVRRRRILDTVEAQMEREHLFFWPLCMTSYARGEGNDWQWPFPNYENGDLFLSWDLLR